MSDLVRKVAETLKRLPIRDHEHSGSDSELDELRLREAAREVLKVALGPQFADVLCHESEDWDWWLKLAPEVKGRAVSAFRQAGDAELHASYPFLTSSTANITIVGNTPTTGSQ